MDRSAYDSAGRGCVMIPSTQLEDLAPVREAKTYGLSEAFIRKCFCDGRLSRHHIGARVYFSKRQLAGLVVVSDAGKTTDEHAIRTTEAA